MGKAVGRPAADSVTTELPKSIIDSQKITSSMNDPAMDVSKGLSDNLDARARMELSKVNFLTAKKTRRDLEQEMGDAVDEANGDTKYSDKRKSLFPTGGTSVEDIKKLADMITDPIQKEKFLTSMVEKMTSGSGNAVVDALLGGSKMFSTPKEPSNGDKPPTFMDMMQAQMMVLTAQGQSAKQEMDSKLALMREEHNLFLERMQLEREMRAESAPKPSGPDPYTEALKVQIDMLKDTIKQDRETMTKISENSGGKTDVLNDRILALTRENLEKERAVLDAKVEGLEKRLQDSAKATGNVNEIMAQLNKNGIPAHIGTDDTLREANEHELRLKELEYREKKELKAEEARLDEIHAKQDTAKALRESAVAIGSLVAQTLFTPKVDRSLVSQTKEVKSIAGMVSP